MIVLCYLLGNTINNIGYLGLLFYASSVSLFVVYILFFFKIKTSIHLLSIGLFTGFFMTLSIINSQYYILLIIITFIFSGVLASARLHLKEHTTKEIYIGFFLGITTPFIVNFIL